MAHSTITINNTTDFDGGGALADDVKLFIQSLNAALVTNSDASGHDLYSVETSPNVTQNIAADGAPFYVNVSNVSTTSYPPPYFLHRASSGTMWLRPGSSGIDNMYIDTGGIVRLVTDGTVALMNMRRGLLNVASGCAVTAMYHSGGSVELPDSSSTDPTTYYMTGGQLNTQRGFGSFFASGGYARVEAGANAITLLDMSGSANVELYTSGTITTARLLGGTLDPAKISVPITITNTVIDLRLPWADKFLNSSIITFTNSPTLVGR